MKPINQRDTIAEILELSANPTPEEIKGNYKQLVKQYHPDRNKSPEAMEYMKKLNWAYAIATGKEKVPIQPPPPPPQQPQVIIQYTVVNGPGTTTYTVNWY